MLISFNLKESDRQAPQVGKEAGRNQETPGSLGWSRQVRRDRHSWLPEGLLPTRSWPPEIHWLSSCPSHHNQKPSHQGSKTPTVPWWKAVPSTFTKPLGCHCYCYRDSQRQQTEKQSHHRPAQTTADLGAQGGPSSTRALRAWGSFKEPCCAFCAPEQPLSRSGTHGSAIRVHPLEPTPPCKRVKRHTTEKQAVCLLPTALKGRKLGKGIHWVIFHEIMERARQLAYKKKWTF